MVAPKMHPLIANCALGEGTHYGCPLKSHFCNPIGLRGVDSVIKKIPFVDNKLHNQTIRRLWNEKRNVLSVC
jgi:hypothetical protein